MALRRMEVASRIEVALVKCEFRGVDLLESYVILLSKSQEYFKAPGSAQMSPVVQTGVGKQAQSKKSVPQPKRRSANE